MNKISNLDSITNKELISICIEWNLLEDSKLKRMKKSELIELINKYQEDNAEEEVRDDLEFFTTNQFNRPTKDDSIFPDKYRTIDRCPACDNQTHIVILEGTDYYRCNFCNYSVKVFKSE